jgi:hypothetical protein
MVSQMIDWFEVMNSFGEETPNDDGLEDDSGDD